MKIEIPPAVDRIINKLKENGFEGYAVGGCVRDTLLGRSPEDWDITTSARPEEVKRIFPRTIDTGIQHGTVTVMDNRTGYEVTTYRVDGEYEDGRHPKAVSYTSSLTEDLKRRDFTINAMAYSNESGIVDEFGGTDDLKKRIIRCVGSPEERFTEDALRILRAIRFSAQLDFEIEAATFEAIKKIAPNMEKVSKERIQTELTKLLVSDHPDRIRSVFERGIGPYISERFAQVENDIGKRGEEGWFCSSELPDSRKYLRWACFLRFSGEAGAEKVLRDLKMDNDTISRVRTLVKWCYIPVEPQMTAVRSVMSKMDGGLFDDLLSLKRYAIRSDRHVPGGSQAENSSDRSGPEQRNSYLTALNAIEEMKNAVREAGHCLYLKDLAITGKDLIEAGIQPGKTIGMVLESLLADVLVCPEHNTKDYLMAHLPQLQDMLIEKEEQMKSPK
ncbi:CCA tRNA nucleotidyltransferase [Clostridium sp. AM58-1XD]|uniref:CCA tRNA nucleotidyltransferase n=1 Tax=Clostridium sp. AM58-1XD TaxID=2292307 RepID=UPI000E4C03AF|nr:CCA tRNA nucleotidyltransferase [Clostridium sp. AM58-1XD]RGY99955.1 CCA tRNA nucleotidyltransferase [Clostridium sp. AM58-1XD]